MELIHEQDYSDQQQPIRSRRRRARRRAHGFVLRKLCLAESKPDRIILYNSAVLLASQGSQVLDAFETMAANGVDILSCGTCLGHFGLLEKLAVGRKSDMQEITGILVSDQVTTV